MEDAIHIAIAAHYGMDYLLTWNCRHIANSVTFPAIRDTIETMGLCCPILTTPDLLVSHPEANP